MASSEVRTLNPQVARVDNRLSISGAPPPAEYPQLLRLRGEHSQHECYKGPASSISNPSLSKSPYQSQKASGMQCSQEKNRLRLQGDLFARIKEKDYIWSNLLEAPGRPPSNYGDDGSGGQGGSGKTMCSACIRLGIT